MSGGDLSGIPGGSRRELQPRDPFGSARPDDARVLVVEDDLNILELVTRALTFAGYAVEQAHDAHTAEEAVARRTPDALVMDVMLPGVDGFTIVHRLRERGLRRPVLYITAAELDDGRLRAIAFEGDAYLPKPFGVTELTRSLAALLTAQDTDG